MLEPTPTQTHRTSPGSGRGARSTGEHGLRAPGRAYVLLAVATRPGE